MSRRSYPVVNKGHIVPRCYQLAWAIDDQVTVHVAGKPEPVIMNIADAGARRRFYSRERPDGTRTGDMEATLDSVENRAAPLLEELVKNPGLTAQRKRGLAMFVGLQMVRSPEFFRTRNQNVRDVFREKFVREHANETLLELAGGDTDRARELAIAEFSKPTQSLMSMTQLALKLAAIIASMRWQLLRTDGALLAYSDQPVVLWPEGPDGVATAPPRPQFGPMTAREVIVPFSPSLALIATWEDLPDRKAPRGVEQDVAATINELVVGQSDRQWMQRIGSRPARTGMPLRSVALELASVEEFAGGGERHRRADAYIKRHHNKRWPKHVQVLWGQPSG